MSNRTLRWITDPGEAFAWVMEARCAGRTTGLVPTMGNLHQGHLSLMEAAKAENDLVAATIFVNPTQFGPTEDFQAYPRTPQRDRELCEQVGIDLIFAPAEETMYPPGSLTNVQVSDLEEPLCGGSRPGHFVGVATIVAKLFNILPATRAYFGRKDYQQALLIQRMAADLNFPVEVRVCPIVREADGLAMSSRNSYLSEEERRDAVVLSQALARAEGLVAKGERDPHRVRLEMVNLLKSTDRAVVDYAEIVDAATLQPIERIDGPALAALAVRFGKTRLIDNALLSP
ncbi:Pantoate-beta-alanine ligase [Planctomycetes bacterium Pan216]|uniref:Pantothenate synthetase n=1 Tax=Kolteria novifilia TaxID=2527975 RepID=A0A518B5U9_9BACT|nr:Pantoate-beta-alanine ligase [Planctomycetes bacterium Pan216]